MSAAISDDDFVSQFEGCRLPSEQFHHKEHLRLAWIYLGQNTLEEAERRMAESIFRFATSLGAAQKYHQTMTVAWMRLVASGRVGAEPGESFPQFIERHRWLLDPGALLSFYSRELLFSDLARARWVEPDLRDLPA